MDISGSGPVNSTTTLKGLGWKLQVPIVEYKLIEFRLSSSLVRVGVRPRVTVTVLAALSQRQEQPFPSLSKAVGRKSWSQVGFHRRGLEKVIITFRYEESNVAVISEGVK